MKRVSLVSFFSSCALICTLIVVIGFMYRGSSSAQVPLAPTPSTHTTPLGPVHAITPDPAKLQSGILPTYTTADVVDYLPADPELGKELLSRPKFTYTISFVPAQDLSKELGNDFTQHASLLCYVEYRAPAPFGIHGALTVAPTLFTYAFEVFDGRTGDYIVWGGQIYKPSTSISSSRK